LLTNSGAHIIQPNCQHERSVDYVVGYWLLPWRAIIIIRSHRSLSH